MANYLFVFEKHVTGRALLAHADAEHEKDSSGSVVWIRGGFEIVIPMAYSNYAIALTI